MNPYYYQHYYAASVPAGSYAGTSMAQAQQAVYPVADPTQPGGYRWVYHPAYVAAHGGMMAAAGASQQQQQGMPAYYFPYHPSYLGTHPYYQQQQHIVQQEQSQARASGVGESSSSSSSSSIHSSPNTGNNASSPPPAPSSVPETSDDTASGVNRPPLSRSASYMRTMTGGSTGVPEPLLLLRKTSQGFSKDQSKWKLSRTSSKASLGIACDTDDEELVNLPSSPMMGRKASLSVSPRHCGSTDFLPDAEQITCCYNSLHIVEAVQLKAKLTKTSNSMIVFKNPEIEQRYNVLDKVMSVQMSMIDSVHTEVVGLFNPVNSKICYLNSVIQILVPISPLMQFMSFCLSHIDEEKEDKRWTSALARCFRLIFHPPMGAHASLLTCEGIDQCIDDLGGIGNQQDVGEALCTVLDRLHEEWKYDAAARSDSTAALESKVPFSDDSLVYKLFRGTKRFGKSAREIFTAIQLAPVGGNGGPQSLTELFSVTFGESQGCVLEYLPPVLCIELSRHLSENQLTTSQTSVPFSGTLEVPKTCCSDDEVCGVRNYQLVGVVVRSGVYANSGHFWVAQRRGSKWFWINDTEISECPDITQEDQADAVQNLISKKLDVSTNWCVLVYADIDSKISIHP